MSTRSLVLIRHGKSDWTAGQPDRSRPLAKRGRRQAPESGRWLAGWAQQYGVPGLALVSPATRAASTWELVAAELAAVGLAPGQVVVEEDLYTFDGEDILELVERLPDQVATVAMTGHNPALEEAVLALTGQRVAMPTSCVAIISGDRGWHEWSAGGLELAWHGRPPAERMV